MLSTNDANSYLASTIGEQAIERVRATVAEQVGEEAARTLLSSVQEIRTGIADAAGGAGQLRDGLEDARDGQSQLADGAGRLADGGSRLATGAGQLADGTAQLATGSAALADGTAQLAAGAHELAAGAARVADGNAELADTADRIGAAVDRAAGLLPEARTEVETRLVAAGVDRATIDEVLGALDPVADKLADGNAQVQSTVSDIDALSSGAAQVSDGAATLAGKLDDAAAGAQTLASGAAGARDGAAGLRDGAADLRDGAATLDDGIGALGDGLARLDDGAGTLADGLDDAVGRIPAASSETVDAQASVIADPVALETSAVTEADSYGAGLAPFFASLAGWIGIYALFLIVKPISRRAVTALHSPIKVTLAGWLTPGILGAVQMVALYGILSLALGFSIANPWGTVGVMLLASLTFAAIILALNVWLGSVGQFVGLVLMVVQLVTAGGTFPWQTLPAPLAWLHHFMPMSFAVDAMRQFMYGGDLARAGSDALVLGGILVGALAITALGVTRMTHTRTLRDLQPSLIG